MITLITGAPGAGKSAALVALLAELAPNRAIYAHGIPDLKIDHQPLADPSQWMSEVPDGSVIVIDEVQTVWRPRGPGQGIPADIQALETHRHRGIDFYIVTQAPRLVHTNVRALVGRHVHLRDVGFLGRYWYEWPECAENCSNGWKSAPIRKKYKLPKQAFGLYKSASVHIKPVRSFPAMLVVAVLALVSTFAASGYVIKTISAKVSGDTPTSTKPTGPAAAPASSPPPAPAGKVTTVETTGPVVESAKPYQSSEFTPVVPTVPESAPAYDHLRQVVSMPRVAGGICNASGCKCYTEQGTVLNIPSSDCKSLIDSPMYDPWRVRGQQQASSTTTEARSTPAPSSAPVAYTPKNQGIGRASPAPL